MESYVAVKMMIEKMILKIEYKPQIFQPFLDKKAKTIKIAHKKNDE